MLQNAVFHTVLHCFFILYVLFIHLFTKGKMIVSVSNIQVHTWYNLKLRKLNIMFKTPDFNLNSKNVVKASQRLMVLI